MLTPQAILSREDGGKQEVLLEALHPSRRGAGNQMSLVGGRKQGGEGSLSVSQLGRTRESLCTLGPP